MNYSYLEAKVLELSEEEKERLIQRLVSAAEPAGAEITAEWLEEEERRFAEYKEGKVKPIPLRDVIDRIEAEQQ